MDQIYNPVVCPFTIVIDSREQAPWTFRNLRADAKSSNRPLLIQTVVCGLKTGDYSIVGLEDQIALERKSKSDLYSTLGGGRDRFVAEMERMAELDYAAVIVEASLESVLLRPPPVSRLKPKTVYRSCLSIGIKYGVQFWFAPSIDFAERTAFRILEKCHKYFCTEAIDASSHSQSR